MSSRSKFINAAHILDRGKVSKIWLSFEANLVNRKPPSFNAAITCCDISMALCWILKESRQSSIKKFSVIACFTRVIMLVMLSVVKI